MPQPIDPNTEIMRIAAAERIQQIADRASLAAQTRDTAAADEHRIDAESQVQRADQKSEQVESELRRRNPYLGRRKRKKKGRGQADNAHTFYDADENAQIAEDPEEHNLDISI